MRGPTISTAAGQLRPSAEARGRGWLQLLKFPNPGAGQPFLRTTPADYWERLVAMAFTLTTSATGAGRSVALNAVDGDGYIFNSTLIASGITQNGIFQGYGDLSQVSPVDPYSSQNGTGSVTSPGAAATIATIPSGNLPAGTYVVYVNVNIAGTPAQGTDNDNLTFQFAGASETLNNEITVGEQQFGPFYLTSTSNATMNVKTIGAATAGAIYSAEITATPSIGTAEFQFPDFVMKSGWGYQLVVGNVQAADQISGISMLVERYPSSGIYLERHVLAEELAEAILRTLAG
jgi:hypothetical protein